MRRISMLAAVVLACSSVVVLACPFCGGPPTDTWAQLVSEADAVILGRLVSANEGGRDQKPFSIVEVVRTHKGRELLPENGRIRIDDFLFGKPGELFIVNGTLRDETAGGVVNTFASTEDANATEIKKTSATVSAEKGGGLAVAKKLVWDLNQPMSEATFDYVVQAPSIELPDSQRLRYYAPFLESSEETVATDAWSEFANSAYDDVKAVRGTLDAGKLRGWISNENLSPERLGLYGMMLGLCGDDADGLFLRQQIGPAGNDDIRFGVEGLMGGLFLLTGEEGLRFVEQSRLNNTDASSMDVYAAVQAVQFVWEYESTLFEKQRLRRAMHPMLQRDDMREIAIRNLSRWEDWSAVSLLPDVYAASRKDDPRTVRAIVGYLLMLQKACQDSGDRPELTEATTLLEEIRKENGRVVRLMEQLLG